MKPGNTLPRLICLYAATVIVTGSMPVASGQVPGLIEFSLNGQWKRGLQLIELRDESVVIGQDGWLHSIESSDLDTVIRPAQGRYEPTPATQIRSDLRREFGPEFEVIATNNFLVVQPRGRGNQWPELFEQSHRAFLTYMQKRNVKIRKGRFPMVAVVFPDSVAMYAEFRRLKIDISRVAGVYANSCNRVMTHDSGNQASTQATVRHEAAHQSAFNTGVHSRVNDTPKWITEGIGQLFEPAAMTDQRSGSSVRDRVNRDSMTLIAKTFPRRNDPEFVTIAEQLLIDDALFADPNQIAKAYAVSWAMMFYLAERQPQKLAELLEHTARRPPFQAYKRNQKRADFTRIAGVTPEQFAKQVSWYLETIQ